MFALNRRHAALLAAAVAAVMGLTLAGPAAAKTTLRLGHGLA